MTSQDGLRDDRTWLAPPVEPDAARARLHRPWSTVLQVGHGLGVAGGAVLVVVAVVLLVAHAQAEAALDADQTYEPYGLFFGALFGAVGTALLVGALTLLVLTARGRRRADEDRPGLLFGTCVAGAVLAVVPVAGALQSGDVGLVAVAAVLWSPYLAVAVRTAVVTRP